MDLNLIPMNNATQQLAIESNTSTQNTEIKEQLLILFVQCGMSPDKARELIPFYMPKLVNKNRLDLMMKALMRIGETWTSEKFGHPTTGDIIAQYTTLKYREANKFRSRNDLKATEISQTFHSEFEKCKEDGITDLNEISEIIMKKIGGDKVKKSKCKLNFCDGKGHLIAIKKGDPFRSEYIFQCKCSDKTDGNISVWNNNNEFEIIKGQGDLSSRK